MADLNFKISQNIILGSYTINRLPQNVDSFGSRFVVIMDAPLKEVGIQDKILQPLLERKIEYFVVDNTADGAGTKEIEHILNLAKQGRVHGIIAAGGTKTIILGMIIASLYNTNRSIYDYIDNSTTPDSSPIPLICIPTTIRAPFAFTPYIPIIDSRSRQIKLFKSQNDLCRLVLWDLNFCSTLPKKSVDSMSLETLCLAIESYISQKASFFSDMLVEKAVELLKYALLDEKMPETATPKEEFLMHGGCLLSIAAATSSIGIANLLALTINARYDVSRSIVSAILLPHILEDAGKFKADKIEKIGKIFGVVPENSTREDAVSAFVAYIRQYLITSKLPVRLKELNLSIDQLAFAAEDAGRLDIINGLGRSTTINDLFAILKAAY